MFRPICIVQITSLATAYIGQPLLTFWNHTEQSWMFSMVVAASKITYILLCIAIAYDKFERDCSQVMHNVNVHNVNVWLHTHVNGSVWHSHSSEVYTSTWLTYD